MRFLTLCITLVISCKSLTREEATAKEFQSTRGDEKGKVYPFRLRRAADIPHVVYRKSIPRVSGRLNTPGDAFANDMNAVFPTLTQSQHEVLKRTYGGEMSIPWTAGRSYELIDFMAPTMQALWRHRFMSQVLPEFPDMRSEVVAVSNCWGTAFEILRGSKEGTHIFYIDPKTAETFFKDKRFSRPIKEVEVTNVDDPAEIRVRNETLEVGDFLLIFKTDDGTGGAQRDRAPKLHHVAIFVDDDLYFEKTSPDDFSTYRFARFKDIYSAYSGRDDFLYEVRRLIRDGNHPIPNPKDLFSVAAQDASTWPQDDKRRSLTDAGGAGYFLIKEIGMQLNPTSGRYERTTSHLPTFS